MRQVFETFARIAVALAWRSSEGELSVTAEEPPVGKSGGVGEDGTSGQPLQSWVASDIGIDPVRRQWFIEVQFTGLDEPQCGFRSYGFGDGGDVEPRRRVSRNAWRCIAVIQRPGELAIDNHAEAGSGDAMPVERMPQRLFHRRGGRPEAAAGLNRTARRGRTAAEQQGQDQPRQPDWNERTGAHRKLPRIERP